MSNELIPMSDIEKMAKAVAVSGLFGVKSTEQAIALMLIAQAQGKHPATIAMEYDIIQNRPALRSQAALSRFQESGGSIKYLSRSDEEVSAEFTHPKGGSLVVTWNMARAKKMGIADKDNWKKQPMIMLQWRAIAEGVRACYPSCLSGSYLEEEAEDIEEFEDKKYQPLVKEEDRRHVMNDAIVDAEVSNIVGGGSFVAPPLPNTKREAVEKVVITDAQRTRMFAIATENRVHTSDVRLIVKKFGFESSKDITQDLYETICDEIVKNKRERQPGEEE